MAFMSSIYSFASSLTYGLIRIKPNSPRERQPSTNFQSVTNFAIRYSILIVAFAADFFTFIIFPSLVMSMFGNILGMTGFFVASIFSASLSTLSSGWGSMSALVWQGFVKIGRTFI
ncbi:uncharacterized protein LOC128182290 [Crassostrea angulata]|uniref:uncharacterized protein LOC128182290 n=1 Tax=Magallana angulata TaxID=2784310 RepID=UPI0022B097A3|nr:uncharacterized protein LOC128182290 [Crassostrea angulata]